MGSNASESDWGQFFDPIEFEQFELVTGGTVDVSRDGATYTISWDLTTSTNNTISGSYEGGIDVAVDNQ